MCLGYSIPVTNNMIQGSCGTPGQKEVAVLNLAVHLFPLPKDDAKLDKIKGVTALL